ncbi:MAG: choice-of-anchor Q domain-containing protein, partial [Syntrophobacteraceae bacterium]
GLAAALLLLLSTPCPAATYYVATTGNDSHTTTQAQNPATPWLTLTKADTAGANEDTIRIAAGIYVENGSANCWNIGKRMTWIADGEVIVRGHASGTRAAYLSAGASGSTFYGITFDGEDAKTDTVNCNSGFTGASFYNCTFLNALTRVFNLYALPSLTNILFDRCTFTNATRTTCTTLAIASAVPNTIAVTNCTFNSRAEGQYILQIGSESLGSYSNTSSATVTGNRFFGVLYFDSSRIGSSTHALLIGTTINATVKGNYFNGCPYGVVVKHEGQAFTGAGVLNNVFVNCGPYSALYSKGAQNVPFLSNTVWVDSDFTTSGNGLQIGANGALGAGSGCVAKNNIFAVRGNGKAVRIDDAESSAGFASDYNVLYIQGGSTTVATVTGTARTWSEWLALGYDAHGINAHPKFLDPANRDFRPSRSSPCINAGTDAGLTSDFRGWPVPSYGAPDIGAHEFWEQGPIMVQ